MSDEPVSRKRNRRGKQDNPGDHYELSGDFRGAVINIKSTLVGSDQIRDIEDLPPESGEPPFQGLQYFDEKDAGRFFGREQLTARIIGRLHRTRFLAVIGASGSGKSSLVRAGVIPALRRGERLADGGLPPKNSGQWATIVLTPTAHPLEALASSLVGDSESVRAISDLQAELAKDPHALSLAARRLLARHTSPHLLLVIDQFEELYTLCRSTEERQAFLEGLLAAVDAQDEQPVTILITLRADFYAHLAQHAAVRELISQHQEFIGAMTRQELVSAIDGPLAQGGWKIQEGLIEVILDDVGYEPGALPLLSHALLETWRRRRGRTLTLSGYTEAGGIAGAIAQTAENVFQQRLSAEQQPVARMVFLRMAELGEDAHATRRRATFDELITRATDELVIRAVINILVDARLVTTGTTQPGETKVVELAHEALIHEWPTLQDWLSADREGLILHSRLADATNDWLRLDREAGLLYRGTRLKQALEWAAGHGDLLSLTEQEFLDESRRVASREAEQAQRLARATRLQRLLAVASLVLILVTGGLAYNFLLRKVPAKMDGFFNVAIAQFSQSGPGVANESDLRNALYEALQEEWQSNPNLQVWSDGPELQTEKYVTIGAVEGTSPDQKAAAAQALAERLNADMILYGEIDSATNPPSLQLTLWLASSQEGVSDDVQGSFQLGDTGSMNATAEGINLQAKALAWMAVGLAESRLGHSLEALEAFQKAAQLTPQADTLQFFIGRETLFLVDRKSVLEFARQAFEAQAEAAFRQAIQLNPSNTRAYTGLGGVYYKRARRLVQGLEAQAGPTPELPPAASEALALVDQAIATFEQAVALPLPSAGEIPVDQVAELGLGNSYLLKGNALYTIGDRPQALAYYERAIQRLQPTVASFQVPGLQRYLAQAYEYLGSAHEGKAITLEAQAQFAESIEVYQQAADYFALCVAQGEGSQDLIIRQEIIGDICQPQLEKVNRTLQDLRGDQG